MREGKVGDMARTQIRLWGKGVTERFEVESPSPLMGCWDRGSQERKS